MIIPLHLLQAKKKKTHRKKTIGTSYYAFQDWDCIIWYQNVSSLDVGLPTTV